MAGVSQLRAASFSELKACMFHSSRGIATHEPQRCGLRSRQMAELLSSVFSPQHIKSTQRQEQESWETRPTEVLGTQARPLCGEWPHAGTLDSALRGFY